MKRFLIPLILMFHLIGVSNIYEKIPEIILFHEQFDKNSVESPHVWRLSLKINKSVTSAQDYEIWWKVNQLEWKQPIALKVGEAYKVVETITPYDATDTIHYVMLYQRGTEVKARIKIIR